MRIQIQTSNNIMNKKPQKEKKMEEFKFDLAEFIPLRNTEVCEKVRKIRKEQICITPIPSLK